ncbi:MAG TPA: MFS transporter [Solirubrobacteraceae bacterium]|nr:MFS transporter [Solirubrobacteraceae bacterium]
MTDERSQQNEHPVLLGGAMVLLAMNLRPAAAAVGPLIHRIQLETGLSGLGAGLLAALPVLCFGALAPLAPVLARRRGPQTAVAVSLGALVAGLLLRLLPGVGFLFAGTALAGSAIAIGNVLLPVLVRRHFAAHGGLMTALYSTALIAVAALAAAISVPVANALGGGWRPGLGIWAAPAAIALAAWLVLRRRTAERDRSGESIAGVTLLLRDRIAWALTLFFALQSAGFYCTLAWLPSIFQSHGASESQAGVLLGVTLVVGIVTSLTVPSLALRTRDQRALAVLFTSCAGIGWLGILLAPMSLPYLWTALLGLGQNATFPLALTLIVLRGGSVSSTAGLSTLVQSVGYVLAAFVPLGIGTLHDATGSWAAPVIVLIALLVPQSLAGMVAGRRGQVKAAIPAARGGARAGGDPALGADPARSRDRAASPSAGGKL